MLVARVLMISSTMNSATIESFIVAELMAPSILFAVYYVYFRDINILYAMSARSSPSLPVTGWSIPEHSDVWPNGSEAAVRFIARDQMRIECAAYLIHPILKFRDPRAADLIECQQARYNNQQFATELDINNARTAVRCRAELAKGC